MVTTPDRFVEDDCDGNCPGGDAVTVDAHAVDRGIDDRAEAAHLAVHRHSPGGDQLVGAAPRRDAPPREKSIEPLRRSERSLEVGEHRALGHRRQVLDTLETHELEEAQRRAEEPRMSGRLLARDLVDERRSVRCSSTASQSTPRIDSMTALVTG